MSDELLKKLDEKLEKTLGSAADVKDRLAEIEKANNGKLGEVEKRMLAFDETLTTVTKHAEKLEAELNKRRFGSDYETDTLRNAIPDEFRNQIGYVKSSVGDISRRMPTTAATAAQSVDSLKSEDPIKYVAVGSWLHAVTMASVTAQRGQHSQAQMYRERAEKLKEALGGVQKAAMAEGTSNHGADFVPTIVEAVLGRVIADNGVVRRSGPTVVQMTSVQHNLPRLDTDFSAYFGAEAATATDAATTTNFSAGNLIARRGTGLATLSLELLQDSVVNLTDFVLVHIGERIARLEDQAALEGTAQAALNFTGLAGATGTNTKNATTTGDALTLTYLMQAAYEAEEESTREGAVWWCHPWHIRDALQLKTGDAGSPWLPMIPFNNDGRTRNLLGWPVYATSVIDRQRTSSAAWIYFGNPKGIVYGDLLGTQFDVDPYGLFDKAQVRLRVLRRTGICVWVPGMFTILKRVTCQ